MIIQLYNYDKHGYDDYEFDHPELYTPNNKFAIELFNTDIKKFFLQEIIPLLKKAEESFLCPLTIFLMPSDDDTKTIIRINHTEFFKFIKDYINDENKLKEIFLELTPSFFKFKFITYCFKVNEETFTYFELLNLIK